MKPCDRKDFTAHMIGQPGPVQAIRKASLIEYYYESALIGVLLLPDPYMNTPARRLIPDTAHCRR